MRSHKKKTISKMVIDNNWVDCISEIDSDLGDPVFLKVEDIKDGIKSDKYIAYPLYNEHKQTVA